MVQRSTPQSDIDVRAFPIRIKVRIPPDGLGNTLTNALLWLSSEVGPGEWAQHPSATLGGEATAFHFCRIEDAACFLEAFPMIELADGTTSRGYTSPLFPRGRNGGA